MSPTAPTSTRIVRFEDTCYVIPQHSASPRSAPRSLPRLVTKSISVPVPVWKPSPRSSSASPDGSTAMASSRASFSLTLPILTTKSSTSPPSARSGLSQYPISSCLASTPSSRQRPRGHSDSSSAPPPRRRLTFPQVVPHHPCPVSRSLQSQSQSQPQPQPQPQQLPLPLPLPPGSDTLPLRPCCEACYSRVDASLAQEHWTFQWSSAAARKHNQSQRSLSMSPPPTIFPWKTHVHDPVDHQAMTEEDERQ